MEGHHHGSQAPPGGHAASRDLHGQLEKIILQSEELDSRSEALKAESREVNKNRAGLAKTGDDLRKRLGASLKTSFGFASEKLIEFGIKPTRRGAGTNPRPAHPGVPPETSQGGGESPQTKS